MLPDGLLGPQPIVQAAPTTHVVSLAGSGKVLCEYIWIGSSGADLKSRTIVLDERPSCPEELPIAEIDGSSYGQAPEERCEIYLQPRKIFPDPFRGGEHLLVLCDTYVPPLVLPPSADPWDALAPHTSNHRAACDAVMQAAAFSGPLFSMQQEYSLAPAPEQPALAGGLLGGAAAAGVPVKALPPGLSGKAATRLGRDVSELHMRACLAAGLSYSAGHASGASGGSSAAAGGGVTQWAYKIGPCRGLDMADQLCVSRFLLGRAAEHSEATLLYDASGGGGGGAPAAAVAAAAANKCTITFSTAGSRDPECGLAEVQAMMERLQHSHAAHLACSGAGPAPHSSGSWHSARGAFGLPDPGAASGASAGSSGGGGSGLTIGVGNKHAAIMVPTSTIINRCGPILDRRPRASADPYLATTLLVASACGVVPPPAAPALAAAQLSAALAAAQCGPAAGARAAPPPGSRCCGSAALPIPASPGGSSCGLADSLPGSGSCRSYSALLSDSLDSHDLLLSELDRLDGCASYGRAQRRYGGAKRSSAAFDDDDASSDASSPPTLARSLAAAAADADMMYA